MMIAAVAVAAALAAAGAAVAMAGRRRWGYRGRRGGRGGVRPRGGAPLRRRLPVRRPLCWARASSSSSSLQETEVMKLTAKMEQIIGEFIYLCNVIIIVVRDRSRLIDRHGLKLAS
jgi:hypothetical protein